MSLGLRSAASSSGRYAAISALFSGFFFSSGMRPQIRYPISTGTSVAYSPAAAAIA